MKNIKKLVWGTLAGGMLLGTSCLSDIPWRALLWDAALYTGYEYLFDNDTSILNVDLFADDGVMGKAG